MKKYKAKCNSCERSLTRTHFDVVFGAYAFFLCPKHQKEMEAFINEHEAQD